VESHTGRKVRRWSDALGPEGVLTQALTELEIKAQGVLAVDDSMRADAFLLLQKVVQPRQSIAAGDLMTELRVCKSAAELELMAQAAALADEAILAGAEACQPGVSEREVASRISTFFRDNGAESVDFTLVASGPNSAFPHHEIGFVSSQLTAVSSQYSPGHQLIADS
jgi:Xaa-Pro aminopeptidase